MNLIEIAWLYWPMQSNICILDLSPPLSHTTKLPLCTKTATFRPRVPEKTLGLTLVAEHVLEHAIFIENLNPVVVSVRHHDVFVSAQAEPMGGVELTFFSTKLPELRPYLHLLHSLRWATVQHFCIGALANSTLVDLQTGEENVVPATPSCSSSAQALIKWLDRFTTLRTVSNTAHLTSDCLAGVAPTDV